MRSNRKEPDNTLNESAVFFKHQFYKDTHAVKPSPEIKGWSGLNVPQIWQISPQHNSLEDIMSPKTSHSVFHRPPCPPKPCSVCQNLCLVQYFFLHMPIWVRDIDAQKNYTGGHLVPHLLCPYLEACKHKI